MEDRVDLAESIKPPCAYVKNSASLVGLVGTPGCQGPIGMARCLVRSCGRSLYFLLVERKRFSQ